MFSQTNLYERCQIVKLDEFKFDENVCAV